MHMKKYFTLIILSFLSISLFSQNVEDGLRIQVGLPFAKYGKFDKNFKNGSETQYPSLLIQADKPWRDGFRLGAYIGFAGQKNKSSLSEYGNVTYNYYRLGGVVSYDLNDLLEAINISPEFGVDLYASLKTGFSLEHIKVDQGITNKDNNILFDFGILIGGRYNISDNIDVFTELGYGNAGFVTFGLAFKM
ncbi:hypothetical protein EMN46_14520 [Ancylomarina sp. 16SWW S1-10-2]|nr:hypothetical protein [Ancylomarina sp. 16SWW S1-10-2]